MSVLDFEPLPNPMPAQLMQNVTMDAASRYYATAFGNFTVWCHDAGTAALTAHPWSLTAHARATLAVLTSEGGNSRNAHHD